MIYALIVLIAICHPTAATFTVAVFALLLLACRWVADMLDARQQPMPPQEPRPRGRSRGEH